MALDEAQKTYEEISYAASFSMIGLNVVMGGLVIKHGHNMYQDFCTDKRVSVSHRRSPPEINKIYKVIGYLTMISIILYLIQVFGATLGYFAINDFQCTLRQQWIFVMYQLSKTSMYLVFIARLYNVYKKSAYSYKLKCVRFSIILICLWSFCGMVACIIYTKAFVVHYGDKHFPNLCLPTTEEVNIFVGGM